MHSSADQQTHLTTQQMHSTLLCSVKSLIIIIRLVCNITEFEFVY